MTVKDDGMEDIPMAAAETPTTCTVVAPQTLDAGYTFTGMIRILEDLQILMANQ